VSNVELRLQQIEDRQDILHLIYTYYHAFDHGLADEFENCWTRDGILRLNADVANVRSPTGIGNYEWSTRETIMNDYFWVHKDQFPPELYWKQINLNPRISLEGDTALVESAWVRLDETPIGDPYLCCFGETRDTVVREPDGRWRFTLREVGYDSRVRMGPKDRVKRSEVKRDA
jgi:hypothetical protein